FFRRLAGDEGLARRGGLSGIWRYGRIRGSEAEPPERQAESIGTDLGNYRIGTLAYVDRALMEHDLPLGGQAELDGRGVGQRGVTTAIPAGGNAHASPPVRMRGVEGLRIGQRTLPMGPERGKAFDDAHSAIQHLAGDRFVPVTKCIPEPERQPVHAKPAGEFVVERFLAYGGLRHTKAPKGARDRPVGVDGTAARAVVRRAVGAA